MKKYLPWIIAGGVVLIFSAGWLIASANGRAALAGAKAQAEQDKAVLLAGQIKDYQKQIADSAAALVKFQADRAAEEKAFLSVLASVKTATPGQLVAEGSAIAGVSDITTDGKIVTMGVESWRLIVSDLVDYKEYRDVRSPAWLVERGMLNDQVAGFKAKEALDAQKDAALAASIADLKSFISQQKVSSVLEKVLWAGAGIGAGILAGHFLK